MTTYTRRRLLALTAGVTGLAGCLGGDDASQTATNATTTVQQTTTAPTGDDPGSTTPSGNQSVGNDGSDVGPGDWQAVKSPTDGTLHAVVTTREGPFAVGEEGVLLGRCNGVWETVLESGLEVTGNGLLGADITANGRHIWFAGGSGAVGRYDLAGSTVTDFSAPLGKTSTWEDVAVAGLAGEEWIYLANGSGEVLRGKNTGGEIDWKGVKKPGSGSSISAIEFVGTGTGFVLDGSTNVFQTTNAGKDWRKVGIPVAGNDLLSLTAMDADSVNVGASAGAIFRYNGFTWTELDAGQASVHGLTRDDSQGLATTSEGQIFEFDEGEWHLVAVPVDEGLYDVTFGTTSAPDVAVGSSGRIVERFR
jgi:streptogramin lyase